MFLVRELARQHIAHEKRPDTFDSRIVESCLDGIKSQMPQ
jgi:hypothetical protein